LRNRKALTVVKLILPAISRPSGLQGTAEGYSVFRQQDLQPTRLGRFIPWSGSCLDEAAVTRHSVHASNNISRIDRQARLAIDLTLDWQWLELLSTPHRCLDELDACLSRHLRREGDLRCTTGLAAAGLRGCFCTSVKQCQTRPIRIRIGLRSLGIACSRPRRF
jgi:hypothetical protein